MRLKSYPILKDICDDGNSAVGDKKAKGIKKVVVEKEIQKSLF